MSNINYNRCSRCDCYSESNGKELMRCNDCVEEVGPLIIFTRGSYKTKEELENVINKSLRKQ